MADTLSAIDQLPSGEGELNIADIADCADVIDCTDRIDRTDRPRSRSRSRSRSNVPALSPSRRRAGTEEQHSGNGTRPVRWM